jgi:NADPH:quinone reductase-like Zn-dependent oxidoreductase
MVRSIGADHVIDYTQEDFTQGGPRCDVIMDNVASHSLSATRRALTPDGILVPSSGHAGMGWIIGAALTAVFVRQQGKPFVASTNSADLAVLTELIDAGKVTPVIDRTYLLSSTPDAFRYLDEGHARGKVVITVEDENAREVVTRSSST